MLLYKRKAFRDFPVVYKRETSTFRCFGRKIWRKKLNCNLISRPFSHANASCGSKPPRTADVYHFPFVLSGIWFHSDQLDTFSTAPMDGLKAKQAKG